MKYQKYIVTVTEVTYARKGGVYTEMKSKFGPVLAYENGSFETQNSRLPAIAP